MKQYIIERLWRGKWMSLPCETHRTRQSALEGIDRINRLRAQDNRCSCKHRVVEVEVGETIASFDLRW